MFKDAEGKKFQAVYLPEKKRDGVKEIEEDTEGELFQGNGRTDNLVDSIVADKE